MTLAPAQVARSSLRRPSGPARVVLSRGARPGVPSAVGGLNARGILPPGTEGRRGPLAARHRSFAAPRGAVPARPRPLPPPGARGGGGGERVPGGRQPPLECGMPQRPAFPRPAGPPGRLRRTCPWGTPWGQLERPGGPAGELRPPRAAPSGPGRAPARPRPPRSIDLPAGGGGATPGGRARRAGRPGHDRYLVDSASSHMLVSKIKPCMSKYKQSVR